MATRHSFLSTTGLLRSPSSASTASYAPSFAAGSPPAAPGKPTRFRHFKNLKSLTLSPKAKTESPAPPPVKPQLEPPARRGSGGVIPLGPVFIVGMAIVISLFFVGALSFAFIGAEDEPVFRATLDKLAAESPGIVLIADNVDVDIDEPAVTLRFSVVACGANFTLPGSEGSHGSSVCGIPNVPLHVYVDSGETPEFTFDPAQLPFTSSTGRRLGIQNIYQFDSDHVLDVHEARLYPFDTYRLATTLRAVAPGTNASIPIARVLTITDTASFIVAPSDTQSYITLPGSTAQLPSRDLELTIARPGEARFFALLLFGVNWLLAHATVGFVALAWRSAEGAPVLPLLALSVGILLAIPGVRGVMPDAPGFDGVLIDQIGLFAQMLLAGLATLALLATFAVRELRQLDAAAPQLDFIKERPAPISRGLHRLRGSTASVDLRALRRPFVANVVPPTPIQEESMREDPFAVRPARRNGGMFGQNAGASVSSTHLLSAESPYSEWV
ncbi:hypothetical protein PsYK624_158980 [Phanerochaete sordida]|uniref:DUF4436 domain-containing protein n=1 Tax=Phanerochaete sordida TaxID=48140 RepID=A0A9P3LMS5_9APHY|nr:hypothetical protein PsYK624_158980 [Phanerochaete sordida]